MARHPPILQDWQKDVAKLSKGAQGCELLPETSGNMMRIAMIRRMLGRVATD